MQSLRSYLEALQAVIAERDAERERFELAQEVGGIGAWEWDLTCDQGRVSDTYKEMHGLSGVEGPLKLGQVMAAIHPDDLAGFKAQLATATGVRTASTGDYRVAHPDGTVRWIAAKGRPVFASGGQLTGAIGVVRDVTLEKEAEAALAESRARLEERVEARTAERDRLWTLSRDAFVVVGEGGMLLACSPALTAILGWSEAELVGRSAEWLLHPDDLARTREARQQALAGAAVKRFENRSRTRDGGWRWLSWTATPGGDRIYAVARDVTDEHEQADSLRLAEEALRQSQKLEAIGQITGGVAHDFNNLLTPILGALDILQRRGVGDERSARLVSGALELAERARLLLQRLLAFARRQPLQAGPIDVAARVLDLEDLLSSTLLPQVAMRLRTEPGLPLAMADANQLELALLNLAVNARDAMPDGGEFTLSVRQETAGAAHPAGLAPGAYVAISARDTGVGMSPEVLERAIEPFFSTKAKGRGTGLGLSMVHGLTAQLGGGMRIDSQAGEGTTVTLWLPVAASGEAPVAAGEVRAGPLERPGGVVLLVDDEALVRASTAQTLADLGYRVVEAASAQEALAHLDGDDGAAVEVLVTDHLMPGMTGADLARTVRARRPEVGVLIISGYTDLGEIAPDLPRLNKPFRQDELAEALARVRAG